MQKLNKHFQKKFFLCQVSVNYMNLNKVLNLIFPTLVWPNFKIYIENITKINGFYTLKNRV